MPEKNSIVTNRLWVLIFFQIIDGVLSFVGLASCGTISDLATSTIMKLCKTIIDVSKITASDSSTWYSDISQEYE